MYNCKCYCSWWRWLAARGKLEAQSYLGYIVSHNHFQFRYLKAIEKYKLNPTVNWAIFLTEYRSDLAIIKIVGSILGTAIFQ